MALAGRRTSLQRGHPTTVETGCGPGSRGLFIHAESAPLLAFARLLERTGKLAGTSALQIRLATYLNRADEKSRRQSRVDAFKDNLLAVNPLLYKALYPEDLQEASTEATDMGEMEQIVPQTEADVDRIMADLAAMGINP